MFTELTVNGETYQLRLTTRTSVQLEKALGFNPLDILIAMEDGKMPKLSDCLIILQYMLLSMNHGFNAEKTMDLYDSYIAEGHTMLELIPIFMDVFKDSGYLNEDASATEESAKKLTQPPSLSEFICSHLQPSINLGLDESRFWDMTIAEVARWQEGAMWRLKSKAQFDYILADLIGISAGRMASNDVEYPAIKDVYPDLFNDEDEKEEHDDDAEIATNNINRFLQFAMAHNAAMTKGGED